MKSYALILTILITALASMTCTGQSPVITAFHANGEFSWTNAVTSNAFYRVEWAAKAGGPWFRTLDNITTLDAHTSTSFSVSVPMFYRVVMITNEPPQGMVWIDGGDVEFGPNTYDQFGNPAPPNITNYVSGFWMDEMEVSKARWVATYNWAVTNGYAFDNVGSGKTNNHPIQSAGTIALSGVMLGAKRRVW